MANTGNIVFNGVNKNVLNLAGKTATQAALICSELMNVDDESIMKVNGTEVTGDYVIQDGDMVEFVKEAGTKGADTVIVQSGINKVHVTIGGNDTVADVLRKAAMLIGIADDLGAESAVNINGSSASSNEKVVAGDRIEVVKEAGSKGC